MYYMGFCIMFPFSVPWGSMFRCLTKEPLQHFQVGLSLASCALQTSEHTPKAPVPSGWTSTLPRLAEAFRRKDLRATTAYFFV